MEPGQFEIKWPKDCAECGDRMKRGDTAGYNDSDEIVCEDCWIPYSER